MIDFRSAIQLFINNTKAFRDWLLEYKCCFWKILVGKPKGEVKDKNWVGNKEWSDK